MAAAPEDRPDVQVFDEIGQIEHLMRVTVTRCLPVGLTYPQYEVLSLLSRRGDRVTPAEIAAALQMTRSGLTNTLQRLCVRKLIEVDLDAADRRKKRVWLTPEGRGVYSASMTALRPKIDSLRDGFTHKEFREAMPFLRALRTWLFENK